MARIGASGTGGAGSGGTPGGNNTDVQFNNSGVFGGSDNFTFDGANTNVPNGVMTAVDFIFSRRITIDITVPDGFSMINTNPTISGTITLLGDAEFLLI